MIAYGDINNVWLKMLKNKWKYLWIMILLWFYYYLLMTTYMDDSEKLMKIFVNVVNNGEGEGRPLHSDLEIFLSCWPLRESIDTDQCLWWQLMKRCHYEMIRGSPTHGLPAGPLTWMPLMSLFVEHHPRLPGGTGALDPLQAFLLRIISQMRITNPGL